MRRILSLILLLAFLLTGCSAYGERLKEPVTFYYLRSELQYFVDDGVIASEERESAGHREDLTYLLALYLIGPADEDLVSPLPKGTKIYSAEQNSEEIVLNISNTTESMTDIEYSAACVCLALTCFDLTDAGQVTVNSGDRTLTISRDAIVLYDNITAMEEQK